MLIQHWLCHAGGIGDVVHRRTVEPSVGKNLESNIEDLLATGRGGKTLGHGSYHMVTGNKGSVKEFRDRVRGRRGQRP